jgi:putative ABC transport system permease protein
MVVGLVTDSRYLSEVTEAVIIPRRTAVATLGEKVFDTTAYVRTERGAADTAAESLPLRLTPQAPERWTAEVPRVPIDVAEGISSDLRNLSLAMAALVMFIGAVAIGNAMMRSVFERMPEIGLRRALGARSRHVLALLVIEATLIGTVAGVLGVAVGVVVSVAVALRNDWPIAVSVWAVAVAVPGAMAVGALGGLLPAITAIRITPSQALRRE